MPDLQHWKPSDGGNRLLIWHSESDCLFATMDRKVVRHCCNTDGCDEVTGIERFETMFNMYGKYHEEAKMEDKESPLHIKHRPKILDDVIGQKTVIKSLSESLKAKTLNHAFIFTGPSGCGKTTLARILASEFGCETSNIIEIDAASNNGIDDMRAVIETLRYTGFGATPNKMIIIDEAHGLSKAAWTSLLKSVEEPPPHVFFAFCSTEESKIPENIKTRCVSHNLKSVKYDDIMDLLESVADQEKFKVSDQVLQQVGRACNGSPRLALVMLAKVQSCTDEDEAAILLEGPLESAEIIDLCRKLLSRDLSWKEAMDVLGKLTDQQSESIRIVVTTYISACLLKPKSEKDVPRLLDILASFSKPCNPTDKLAPILLALGAHIYPPG